MDPDMNTNTSKSRLIRISSEDDIPLLDISPEVLDAISEAIEEIFADANAAETTTEDTNAVFVSEDELS